MQFDKTGVEKMTGHQWYLKISAMDLYSMFNK
jgi:hypothetical protein